MVLLALRLQQIHVNRDCQHPNGNVETVPWSSLTRKLVVRGFRLALEFDLELRVRFSFDYDYIFMMISHAKLAITDHRIIHSDMYQSWYF